MYFQYSKESEGCYYCGMIHKLNINWKINEPIVSIKDKKAKLFENFKSPFK